MAKSTQKQDALTMFSKVGSISETKTTIEKNIEPKKEEIPVKIYTNEVEEKTLEVEKKTNSAPVEKKSASKKAPKKTEVRPGRPATRGEIGVDYKRMSLSIPIGLYDRIRKNCYGNMTQYIIDILDKHA